MTNEARTKGELEQGAAGVEASLAGLAGPCRRLVPVILAGGSGTRLWPMSREQFPKQLIGVIGHDSLLQATVSRLKGFAGDFRVDGEPIIVKIPGIADVKRGQKMRFAADRQKLHLFDAEGHTYRKQ